MDKIIVLSLNRFSYNSARALKFLDDRNIEYRYFNFRECIDNDSTLDFSNQSVLVLDNDIPIRVHELDYIRPSNISSSGHVYHKLKSSNVRFYNNVINHFRCFNKWHVFNLLIQLGLPVPISAGIGRDISIKDTNSNLYKINPPFFVRDTDTESVLSTSIKLNFISSGIKDLEIFYDEYLKESWDTYLVQEYIPHDSIVTGHYLLGDIKFTVECLKDHSTSQWQSDNHLHDTYTDIIKTVHRGLGLNCFSIFFIGDKIIKLKTPMQFSTVDRVFNINSINTLMESIVHAPRRD